MIIDLIKEYSNKTTVVSGFSVGSFVFDCQLEESHESRLTVSENALESGAIVADHSYLEPKTYSVQGLVVSYNPPSQLARNISSDLRLIKTLPFLNGIVGQTEQAIARVSRLAGQVSGALTTAANVANRFGIQLPNSINSLSDSTQDTLTRQQRAYQDLLYIQANGQFLSITSGLKSYSNVLLTGVVANKGIDDAVTIALEFREQFITETRTVQGLVVNVPARQAAPTSKPDGDKKTGRAKDQAAKPKSKGTVQPVQQSGNRKSVARSIGDVIRGL